MHRVKQSSALNNRLWFCLSCDEYVQHSPGLKAKKLEGIVDIDILHVMLISIPSVHFVMIKDKKPFKSLQAKCLV